MHNLKDKTALVTGASSGIGLAIARRFAAEGVNLVLVARSEAVLARLADDLTKQYGIRASIVAIDLARPDCGTALLTELTSRGISVDILVNNAGFGTYGPFETVSPEAEQNEIAVNISALVSLSHAFIPGMLERGAGWVLNLASVAAFQPGPYLAVYAASKAFVLSFSEALWAEYCDRGVHVVALCPGAVDTPFIDRLGNDSVRKTSIFSKSIQPDHVAVQAFEALRGKAPIRIIGFKNWLMVNSVRFAPRRLVAKSSAKMLKPPA